MYEGYPLWKVNRGTSLIGSRREIELSPILLPSCLGKVDFWSPSFSSFMMYVMFICMGVLVKF